MIYVVIYIIGFLLTSAIMAMISRSVIDSMIGVSARHVKNYTLYRDCDPKPEHYIFLILCHIFWPITLIVLAFSGLGKLTLAIGRFWIRCAVKKDE